MKKKIKNDKMFMFMVIHDLKHPTEAVINQLQLLKAEMLELKKTVTEKATEI